MITLERHLTAWAYQNAWANHRLLKACTALSQAEFTAARTSFFPSIKATLNHIVTVDWMYVDAMERAMAGREPHPDIGKFYEPEQPFEHVADLAPAQAAVDRRLITHCAALEAADLERPVAILRRKGRVEEAMHRLLAHVFEHQIHHRGQVHAMLAGTTVAPPQLDEFFCANEADLRASEFAELGFSEAAIWRGNGEQFGKGVRLLFSLPSCDGNATEK
ncbi:MAG TPA: DinB family protein [Usitatibacteraceae bacterium]|nr:DinB family protein [Usitatibacteraceae bacterium]